MVKNRVRTCSSKNCKEKHYVKGFCRRHYRQIPEVKAKENEYRKEYRSRSEVKAKENEYRKEYRDKPENKVKEKEYRKKYDSKPERKAKQKEHKQKSEYKVQQKEYRDKPEIKARTKARISTPEFKAKRKEYSAKPEVKARIKSKKDSIRLKVLQYYSKRLSKSNIPCCRCCGDNFHIDFLAVDHIAGIKKMDLEPELVKLGYSSSMLGLTLMKWIIVNNFPKGFQILCHNCNFAKGIIRNNNKCPHQE